MSDSDAQVDAPAVRDAQTHRAMFIRNSALGVAEFLFAMLVRGIQVSPLLQLEVLPKDEAKLRLKRQACGPEY